MMMALLRYSDDDVMMNPSDDEKTIVAVAKIQIEMKMKLQRMKKYHEIHEDGTKILLLPMMKKQNNVADVNLDGVVRNDDSGDFLLQIAKMIQIAILLLHEHEHNPYLKIQYDDDALIQLLLLQLLLFA